MTYCAIIIYNMKAPKRRTAVQKSSFQMRRHISIIELLDRFFFVFSGVATLWLGVLLFMVECTLGLLGVFCCFLVCSGIFGTTSAT